MKIVNIGIAALAFAALAAGCSGNGLSSEDATEAAKQRVRETLGLSQEAALFGKVYVGEPLEGEQVLCGTVRGTRADGRVITPRRFAITSEEPRWLIFETADRQPLPSRPDKFIEWHTTCFNEEEV